MRPSLHRPLGALLIFLLCVLAWPAVSLLAPRPAPARRDFTIAAHQYAYQPGRIVVNQGDEVHLRLAATDAVHGLWLEGHDLEAHIYPGRLHFKARRPSTMDDLLPMDEVSFTAGPPGKYRYRCSVTCGALHPFMQGELIVRPNLLFQGAAGGVAGILLAGLFLALAPGRGEPRPPWRLDLLQRFPFLRSLLRNRWFPFALMLPLLGFFLFFLLAGYLGTPMGNRNAIITVVWILWWFLLITFLVPLLGRVWCMVCPFPLFGDWLQRRRLVEGPGAGMPRCHPGGLRREWPAALSNTWLQLALFLLLCTFSTLLVTRPIVSAVVLTFFLGGATALAYTFRERAFCSFVCPLNGWMSLYSMGSAIEVRSRRAPEECAACESKTCRDGTSRSWPCPWGQDPGRMERNNYCGLCLECVKGCRNMTVRLRPFFSDTKVEGMSEAFFAFVMISLVVFYAAVMQGPWGAVKEWANFTESGRWQGFLLYAPTVWVVSLGMVPGLWWAAAALGRRMPGPAAGAPGTRELFVRSSYMLVPLGLLTWVGFTFPLILLSGTHVLGSLSDPLGWGWDLFGTAGMAWRPLFPEAIPYLQSACVLAGLAMAVRRGGQIIGSLGALLPFTLLCAGIALGFLRLFAG